MEKNTLKKTNQTNKKHHTLNERNSLLTSENLNWEISVFSVMCEKSFTSAELPL